MVEIEWEAPNPTPRRTHAEAEQFVAELRAHPEQWAVRKRGGSAVSRPVSGPLSDEHLEWSSQRTGTGEVTTYIRWCSEPVPRRQYVRKPKEGVAAAVAPDEVVGEDGYAQDEGMPGDDHEAYVIVTEPEPEVEVEVEAVEPVRRGRKGRAAVVVEPEVEGAVYEDTLA